MRQRGLDAHFRRDGPARRRSGSGATRTRRRTLSLGVSLLSCGGAPFGSKNENEDAEYRRLVGEVVEALGAVPAG